MQPKLDATFVVFRNEHGEAEFAMQVVKDAKGMTFTPDKRWVLTPQGIYKAFQNGARALIARRIGASTALLQSFSIACTVARRGDPMK